MKPASPPSSGTACPLCAEGASRPTFAQGGFDFRECRSCRSFFVQRVPTEEELTRFYTGAGEKGSTFCWEVEGRHDLSSFDRALRAVESRGPVLDVGCGTGPFLAHARQRGWTELTGLELSPAAAEAARRRSGATVLEATLDAQLPTEHFAMVAMWDVLEHLREPRKSLIRVRALVRPGGVVAISTPNRFGLALWAFGRRSVVVCPPEHLLVASRRGLAAALSDAGFDLLGLWSEDLRIREWTRAWSRSSEAQGRDAYHAVQGALTTSRWFGAARAAANLGLRSTRLGDQLLAVAVRR